MSEAYAPPFRMTEEIAYRMTEIGELVGRLSVDPTLSLTPKLRKETRIRSIYSSLAIEQNTLSLSQVTDVIEGRRVLGPPDDIQEVKNALEAYRQMEYLDPCSVDDLLSAHRLMMRGLIDEAGAFRKGQVGIFSDGQMIHKGAPPELVPGLMAQLLAWLRDAPAHPLIKSCVFHYEFENIHPFMDGNGRMGRFWQTLILQKWQPVMAWLPVESLIHERQGEYYATLSEADRHNDATGFIAFMLRLISEALRDICNRQLQDVVNDVANNVVDQNAETLLMILRERPHASARELAPLVRLSARQVQRTLAALQAEGRLIRHGSPRGGYWEVSGESPHPSG